MIALMRNHINVLSTTKVDINININTDHEAKFFYYTQILSNLEIANLTNTGFTCGEHNAYMTVDRYLFFVFFAILLLLIIGSTIYDLLLPYLETLPINHNHIHKHDYCVSIVHAFSLVKNINYLFINHNNNHYTSCNNSNHNNRTSSNSTLQSINSNIPSNNHNNHINHIMSEKTPILTSSVIIPSYNLSNNSHNTNKTSSNNNKTMNATNIHTTTNNNNTAGTIMNTTHKNGSENNPNLIEIDPISQNNTGILSQNDHFRFFDGFRSISILWIIMGHTLAVSTSIGLLNPGKIRFII